MRGLRLAQLGFALLPNTPPRFGFTEQRELVRGFHECAARALREAVRERRGDVQGQVRAHRAEAFFDDATQTIRRVHDRDHRRHRASDARSRDGREPEPEPDDDTHGVCAAARP